FDRSPFKIIGQWSWNPSDLARAHDFARRNARRVEKAEDRGEHRTKAEPAMDEEDASVGPRRGVAERPLALGVVVEAERRRARHRGIAGEEEGLGPARVITGRLAEKDRPAVSEADH